MRGGFGLVRTMLEHVRHDTTLEIWGDGEQIRDYVYIDDVVEATCRFIAQTGNSGVYNLGFGVGHTVNEVKAVVESICGRRLRTVYRPGRGSDVRQVILDVQRLLQGLNWRPEIALEEGVGRTWKWLQQQ